MTAPSIEILVPAHIYANLRSVGSFQSLTEAALRIYLKRLAPDRDLGFGNPAGRCSGPVTSFNFIIPPDLTGKLPWGNSFVCEHVVAAVLAFARALKLDSPEPAPIPQEIKPPQPTLEITLLDFELRAIRGTRTGFIEEAIKSYAKQFGNRRPPTDLGKLFSQPYGQRAVSFKVALPETTLRLIPNDFYKDEYIRAALRKHLEVTQNG